ncbi:hypothetical protein VN23_09310 [Janthinobacterium sp. B9-8]|nr:hypothetical protein VN23_09310 [Janthinobacterium sp. B9-8]
MGRAVVQVLSDFLGVGFTQWGITGFIFANREVAKIITDPSTMIAVRAKFAADRVIFDETTALHFAIAIPRTKKAYLLPLLVF